jgi:hypothetical protein
MKIIEEVKKNPGEKRVDIAKRLGLKNYAKHMGLQGVWREKNEDDENEQEMVPSFTETYEL